MMEPPPANQAKTADSASADPLASLHKMSRTAGLGAQEYVAVNPAAVVAFLLGVASFTAVLGNALLVIPLATLVVAIIAILQIRRSAGTQTGLWLAVAGLLLAGGFVTVVGGRAVIHARTVAAESDAVAVLIEQLGNNVSQAKYDAAWQQFSSRFHERVKRETFDNVWISNQSSPLYGQIKSIRWNGILDVQIDPETGNTTAEGFVVFELVNGKNDRRYCAFRKEPQRGWTFDDITGYFPAPEPPRQQG
jgi:hypothetical protein